MITGSAPLRGARVSAGLRIPGSYAGCPVGRAMAIVLAVLTLRGNVAASQVPPAHLVLPLLTTLAFGRSFLEMRLNAGVSEPPGAFRDRARAALGFLPASLTIPDLYVVDVAEREPRRFAAPLDRTTYGSFNLLPARLSGGRSLSAKYSTESPPAFGESQMLLRLVFEVKF
jgi:hypothetical protein